MQFTYLTTVLLAAVATAAPVPNVHGVGNALEVREAGLPGVPGLSFLQGFVTGVTEAKPDLSKLPQFGKREAGSPLDMVASLLSLTKGGLPGLGKREAGSPLDMVASLLSLTKGGLPGLGKREAIRAREAAALPEAVPTPEWDEPPPTPGKREAVSTPEWQIPPPPIRI